jgi:hypothetical protein
MESLMKGMHEDKKDALKQRIKNAAQSGYSGAIAEDQSNEIQPEVIKVEYDVKQTEQELLPEPIIKMETKIEEKLPSKVPKGKKSETNHNDKVKIRETKVKKDRAKGMKDSIKVKKDSFKVKKDKIKVMKDKVKVKKDRAKDTNDRVKGTKDRVKRTKIVKPNREKNEKHQKHKKSSLFILSVLLCSILLMSVVVTAATLLLPVKKQQVLVTNNRSYDPAVRNINSSGVIEEGELNTFASNEQERLNALAEDSRVYCIISSSPYFPDSDSMGSLFISNPEESKYFTQVVIKAEDNREMYISPILAPNEKIEYDYLTNRDFEQGSHKAYAYFNYYARNGEETGDYLGSMCAEITVVID